MSNSDQPQPEDEQGKQKSRRRLVISALIAVAIVALVVGFGTLLPKQNTVDTTTPTTPDSQVAIEAPQEGKDGDTEQPSSDTSSDTASNETCQHDWTVTYKTVHHDAVTHTETVDPVYGEETTYHTVCNDCGQVIDGIADQHIKDTGHSGYSTNVPITDEVVVSEGYTHEVTDTPAYDELVADQLVCTLCGATRPLDSTTATE